MTEIKITDNTRIGKHWIKDLPAFSDGTTYTFKPGINVIIGKNGSGKSTLLELIYDYTLCQRSMVSEVPKPLLLLDDLFDRDGSLWDGIEIHHDYLGSVFRYLPREELRKTSGSDTILGDIKHVSLFMSKASTGESIMEGLGMLFKLMFTGETHLFPLKELKRTASEANDIWKPRLEALIEYYKKNHQEEGNEYTVLMDEPDRNLDIENISEIYQILSYHKPMTQIVAVIHNPLLIYKLSRVPEVVNIIEITPGYLQGIIDFVENTL